MSENHEGAPEGVTQDTTAAEQVADQTLAQGDEQFGDDAPAETEGQAPAPKPKKSVQERIDELTAARREAERDRDFYREQALRQTDAPTNAPRSQAEYVDEDPAPSPDEFEYGENDARFIRAHATWEARREVSRQFEERAARQAEEAERQRFNERAMSYADATPDFFDVVGQDFGRAAAVMTPVMQQAARTAEEAPAVAYHLAKHPAEARRIAALNPFAQAVEIGKLAARFGAQPASRPTPQHATNAPEPPPQVRGPGGRFKPSPDTDDFAAFEKTYG